MKLVSAVLQAGGVVTESFTEGWRWYQLEQASREMGDSFYPVSRYLGVTGINLTEDQIPVPLSTDKTAVAALANSAIFRSGLIGFSKDVSGDVAILDKLNEFSVQTNLVSPYSSLLALVNEQQKETLEQLEQDYNRYQDQQMTQQNRAALPPTFEPASPGLSPISGLFDVDLIQMNLQPTTMEFGGGGGTTGVTGVGGSSYRSISGLRPSSVIGMFGGIFVYGGLLLLGFGYFFVKMLRRHKK
jgi:hypothetical protein